MSVFEQNVSKLASEAWAAAFEGVSKPGLLDYARAIFSPAAWLCLLTYLGLILVMVIKMLVIDVLWPVILGVVVFSGVIAVPIGVFPGVNSLKGWVMNLIEVSMWPIVFQIVITLLCATFATQLEDAKQLRIVWDHMDARDMADDMVFSGLTDEHEDKVVSDLMQDKYGEDVVIPEEVHGMLYTFVKYLAILGAYACLCLFTPILCRIIIRSESASTLGTMVAGLSTAVAIGAAKHLSDRYKRARERRSESSDEAPEEGSPPLPHLRPLRALLTRSKYRRMPSRSIREGRKAKCSNPLRTERRERLRRVREEMGKLSRWRRG